MNKNKKIAMAVVSTVMAGTMALAFTACGDPARELAEKPEKWTVNKADGSIDYSVYSGRSKVTLNVGIGHNNNLTSTSFKALGGSITLPDGKSYEDGNMKPAWVQMGADLNIEWNDVWGASSDYQTSKNIKSMLSNSLYDKTDLFTTDLSEAVSYAAGGTEILNLGDYLEYMPNFSNFLNNNPIVYLSLLQAGMNTTTGEGKNIYVAPYFDGNDDIERYCLIRHDWADTILNGSTALTTTDKVPQTHKVEAFMGKTGTLEIESLNSAGTDKITIVKDYDAVVTAIKGTGALHDAYTAIVPTGYAGNSGNIIDIMNEALDASTDGVEASKLATLFRAYIDVCYHDKGSSASHYAAYKRSDLFNGYDACWDVDDLVALLRIVMHSKADLCKDNNTVLYGIVPRSGQNDRTPDMVRLAAQLYGVRGADSRYENTYIDNNGDLQDARNDLAFYEALEKFHALKEEGLIADYSSSSFSLAGALQNAAAATTDKDGKPVAAKDPIEGFMMYDYSQTQTSNGFLTENSDLTNPSVLKDPTKYNFGAILTPVSKWDVNGDGQIDLATEVFRFTESWRSTKPSGLALNGNLKYKGYEDKLIAALQFVDYLYSEDGQIVSTYGPMATKGTDGKYTGGFWEGNEVTDASAAHFNYKGKMYAGTDYKGKITPKITQDTYNFFLGKEVNKQTLSGTGVSNAARSFTNFARELIGSTLPVGVKDQSFENQFTSKMGQGGAGKVGVALAAGVVKGMTLKMDSNNWWFVCVPTGLPNSTTAVNGVLNNSSQDKLRNITGRDKDGRKWYSIFNSVILNGTNFTYNQQSETLTTTSAKDMWTQISNNPTDTPAGLGGKARENALQQGWNTAKSYWDFLKPAN